MGSRLGDRTVANVKGLEEGNKLIHIDLDPAEIGKNTQPYIPVVGDIKDVLEQLTSQISGYKTSKEWIEEADELRQRFTHKPVCEDNGFVNPKYFLNVLSEKTIQMYTFQPKSVKTRFGVPITSTLKHHVHF